MAGAYLSHPRSRAIKYPKPHESHERPVKSISSIERPEIDARVS